MSEPTQLPFLKFLEAGVAKGGFEVDDVLAAILPLMKQVLAAHEAGLVAPLDGIRDLTLTDAGQLLFAPARVNSRENNSGKVEAMQSPVSSAVEVVGESRRVADVDQSTLTVSDLGVGADAGITRPVFLADYRCWEHAIGHHDELTDVFSLGLLLASVACACNALRDIRQVREQAQMAWGQVGLHQWTGWPIRPTSPDLPDDIHRGDGFGVGFG